MKVFTAALLMAIGFSTLARGNVPDYHRRILVSDPETGLKLTVFEDDLQSESHIKTFYYRPQFLRIMHDDEGKPVFQFSFHHDTSSGSSVSFKMELTKPPLLSTKPDYVRHFLADRFGVDETRILVLPLTFDRSETKIFYIDGLISKVLPPSNIDPTSELPFYLRFNNTGTVTFQRDIIDSNQTLGVLRTTVLFKVGQRFEEKSMSFAISLDEVPLCAVSASGC